MNNIELQEKFSKLSVLVVGDVYLDIDYIGGYSGYSREKEQLPIFQVEEVKYSPGGAGNLAVCFSELGVNTTIAGYWGNGKDPNASILNDCLGSHHIDVGGMLIGNNTPTFGKVYLRNGQHIYRIDLIPKKVTQNMELDIINGNPTLLSLASGVDFIACADYEEVNEFGVCSKKVIETLNQSMKVKFATSRCNMMRFKGYDYLIQNQKEVNDEGISLLNISDYVKSELIVTNGGIGAKTYFADTKNDIMSYSKELTENIDPCGCGDMFYAAYSSSVMSGYDTTISLQIANSAARVVVRKLFGTGQANCREIEKEYNILYMED